MAREEFSQKEIKKAVLRESVQHPATIYPIMAGLLGVISIPLWGVSLLTITGAAVGIGIATLSFGNQYLRLGHKHSLAYLSQLHQKIQQEREDKLQQLETDLTEVKADIAISQLELFIKKFDNFKQILGKKFVESELTYSRYLGIAEQVFLAGLDNLEDAYLALKSISAVDIQQLQQRLDNQQQLNLTNDELDSLQKRQSLYEDQKNRVAILISNNEKALTEIDNVSAKLANVQTRKGHAELDMDLAMEELSRMAKRAHRYSHN